MHISTDNEETYLGILICDTCIVEMRISTFSPVYEQEISLFSTIHASCSTDGRPDFEKAIVMFSTMRRTSSHLLLLDELAKTKAAEIVRRNKERHRSKIRD